MSVVQLLFGFSGSINRAKYWLTVLISCLVLIVFVIALPPVFGLALVILVVPIATIIVSSIAVGIKRLHDRDMSGWWLFVFYALPAVFDASVWFAIGWHSLFAVLPVAGVALRIWGFVVLGCLRGTAGANAYG